MENEMKAVMIDDDRRLHWKAVPTPVARDNEVVIRIHATAVNRADLVQR